MKSQFLKNFMLLKNSNTVARLVSSIKSIGVVFIRNDGRPLINQYLRISRLVGVRINFSLVKVLISFLFSCSKIAKRNSIKFLCLYLKVCFIILQQVISGYKVKDISPMGCRVSRTRSGLPRLIPSLHRDRIRNDDFTIIQFWLTLFSLYRVLEFKRKFSLKSICSPSSLRLDDRLFSGFTGFIPIFIKELSRKVRINLIEYFKSDLS